MTRGLQTKGDSLKVVPHEINANHFFVSVFGNCLLSKQLNGGCQIL